MALLLATITTFILAFSALWVMDQKRHDNVSERIAVTFERLKFADQKISARDRIFKLFPLEPAPLLFEKLRTSEELLSGPALYLSTKFLGSLLIASLFGFAIASLGTGDQNLHRIDILMWEIVLFGSVFFLTRNPNARHADERTDTVSSRSMTQTFSGF